MLDTSRSNGTRRAQGGHRYWVQWVRDTEGTDLWKVVGYCVRDMDTFNGDTVFRHESKIVCEKIAGLLNEGSK